MKRVLFFIFAASLILNLNFCNRKAEHGFTEVFIPAERILVVEVSPSTLILAPGLPRKSFNIKVCFYGQDTANVTVSVLVRNENDEIPWWFEPFYLNLSGVCANTRVKMPLNVTDVEGGLYSVKASTVNFPAGTYTASADLVIIAPEEEENEPPSAYFTYTPSDVYVGTEVYFDASASEDSDGEIVRYRWKIDGAWVGEGRTFSWKFTTPGIHQVTLEVVDDQGAEGYYSENIDVQE